MDLNLSWSQGGWSEWTLGYRQIGFDISGDLGAIGAEEGLSADIEISGPYLNFGMVW